MADAKVTAEMVKTLDSNSRPAVTLELTQELLRRFFEILATRETTDRGTEFSPVYISSCRVLLTQELGKILKELKILSKYEENNNNTDTGYLRSN